ncbi:MAG: type II toxin-antitoxin system Phd/YefM family antitoxin [Desulfobacteraceae bacterium]|nr:MAG: type II toxin-antitoxin system Phd/YefM family antitoxin [Desulfobacteraceae bacterium]
MEKSVSATEAVRDFSGLLNLVRFKGDTYIIKRGGKPVARIVPVEEAKVVRTLKEFGGLLDELPKLGSELEGFEEDLNAIVKAQPSLPEENPWE